jgi:hypothetical protein
MARMIPALGPFDRRSDAESSVYHRLARGLPDDFTVIHSLPWLGAAIGEAEKPSAPSGEIDFIVLHPELGLLALEVKGGRYRVDGAIFTLLRSGKKVDVINQTRKNFHGLTQCLGKGAGLRLRCGYGFIFPDSYFGDDIVSLALADVTVDPPSKIFADKHDMPDLASRITDMMRYWRQAHANGDFGRDRIERIVNFLCPGFDGTPTWGSRIAYDGKAWLRLSNEQMTVVERALKHERTVVSGWPGTGKTLIGIEVARQLSSQDKRALLVTFNSKLADHIQSELSDTHCKVTTWHKLCADARRRLKRYGDTNDEWFQSGCAEDLGDALKRGLMDDYDTLIIDEAQALLPSWCTMLSAWFRTKTVLAFCDESQRFSFEKGTDLKALCQLLEVAQPYVLSIVMRMPKAVTERLMGVRDPGLQLTSPRDVEPDTIRELLSTDFWGLLTKEIDEYIEQGVQGSDICVLFPADPDEQLKAAIRSLGVRFDIVNRFRGLESPIIIIPWAASMDEAELFCAYSRATTACVALYRAQNLADYADGKFHRALLEVEKNRAFLEQIRNDALTRNIMAEEFDAGRLSLQTMDIAWSKSWGAWLVALKDHNHPAITWLDFLACAFRWPIFYWHEDTERAIYTFSRDPDDPTYVQFGGSFEVKPCRVCGGLRPHTFVKHVCISCRDEWPVEPKAFPRDVLATIKELDRTLLPAPRGDEESKRRVRALPMPLAAAAARRYAFAKSKRTAILSADVPVGTLLYRSALAFTHARIALVPKGEILTADDVADKLCQRYECIAQLDKRAWRNLIASALNVCRQKNLLMKLPEAGKAAYMAVEDDN